MKNELVNVTCSRFFVVHYILSTLWSTLYLVIKYEQTFSYCLTICFYNSSPKYLIDNESYKNW